MGIFVVIDFDFTYKTFSYQSIAGGLETTFPIIYPYRIRDDRSYTLTGYRYGEIKGGLYSVVGVLQ